MGENTAWFSTIRDGAGMIRMEAISNRGAFAPQSVIDVRLVSFEIVVLASR